MGVWFDASDGSTLTRDATDTSKLVGWRDKSGNGRNATADPSYAPTVGTLNGRSALDFSAFQYSQTQPHMFYPEVQVSTVFKVWGSAAGGAFMMTNRFNYSWHRGSSNGYVNETDPGAPILEGPNSYSEPGLRTGDAITRLNGAVVDPTTTGLSGNWDIVDMRANTGNTYPSDTISEDRTYRTGGQGIAEIIVMTSRPSECDVQRIEGYLAWKWGLQGKLSANHAFKNRAPSESPLCNGGFEAGATANNGFQYGPSDQGPWSLSGGAGITAADSGIIANNASGPPEGRLAAFIQNQGTIAQSFTVPMTGDYAVYFRTVNRATNDRQVLQLTIDGTTLFQQTLPHDPFPSVWMSVATPPITLSAGSHTIQFAGVSSVYDATGFFDDVRVELATPFVNTQLLGSFEEWQVGAQNYQYNPGAQPWTFTNAGLVANGSGLGNADAPQGAQAAFLPNNSSIAQTWTDPGGTYTLSFSAATRPATNNSTLTVTIDGATVLTQVLLSGTYATFQTGVTLSSSDHTIRFASSDGDSFVDNVKLVAPSAFTLVSELHLDESGWNGTTGEAIDSSGNGHPATGTASPSPIASYGSPARTGNPGTCSYARMSGGAFDLTGLPLLTTAGDKTSISFWMYWDGSDDVMALGWQQQDLWFKDGAFGFNSGSNDIYGIASSGLSNGWHHVAAVFTNGNVAANTLYIDGVVQSPSQLRGNPNNGSAVVAAALRLGGWTFDSGRRFTGNLDEFRIYIGALTQAEVTAAMNAGHACSAPPLQGGFDGFETSTAAGAISGVIHTKIAGSAFSVDVIALDQPRTGVLTSFTGTVKVEILNAADNSGAFDGGACRASWVPVTGGASVSVTLAGGDAGRKTVTLTEPEAWRDLRLRITTPATGTAATQSCSSDDFAMRPVSFASFSVTDATSATAGTARSLANTGTSGGVVHKAGQPFTVRATAINGTSVTTANYAGTPNAITGSCSGSACRPVWVTVASEGGAFTVSGTQTVRYGADTRWNMLVVSGTVGCDNPTFGDPANGTGKSCQIANVRGTFSLVPSAAAGVINQSGRYSEVGAMTLQLIDSTFATVDASDGSTATEKNIGSGVINVGRFVPDHFDVKSLAAPVLRTFDSSTCTSRSFTYVGQPFGYVMPAQATVLARNAAGVTTVEYSGALWKLSASSVTQAITTTPAAPTVDTSGVGAATLTSNDNGTGLLVGAAGDKLRFNRPVAVPTNPFNANLALAWSVQDGTEVGVSGNGMIATTTPLSFTSIAFDAGAQMRFGDLRINPAYGSELIDLPVLVEARYWDGQRMALNSADQCTTLPRESVAMSNFQRNLSACKTAVASNLTLTGGRAYAKLAKPGPGNGGSVNLTLQLGAIATGQVCNAVGMSTVPAASANMPWLQGRWSGAAAFDQNGATRASFGQYRSPLIYQREVF